MSELFCFGFGYTAQALAQCLKAQGWSVSGSTTSREGVSSLEREGWCAVEFDGRAPSFEAQKKVETATHILVSVPPSLEGDSVLHHHAEHIRLSQAVRWIGYLSTIGVYGDRQGAWVDEESEAQPVNERSRRRLAAERAWLDFADRTGKPVQIFRLAGIYGPGRSAIDNLKGGTARRIVKPHQVFNRIHVDDIVAILRAAMGGRGKYRLYNVSDDEPAPPQDVIAFGAQLLGIESPPEVPFGAAGLTDMAASFYAENKRVRNDRIKSDLGVALTFPTYREGLRSILTDVT